MNSLWWLYHGKVLFKLSPDQISAWRWRWVWRFSSSWEATLNWELLIEGDTFSLRMLTHTPVKAPYLTIHGQYKLGENKRHKRGYIFDDFRGGLSMIWTHFRKFIMINEENKKTLSNIVTKNFCNSLLYNFRVH